MPNKKQKVETYDYENPKYRKSKEQRQKECTENPAFPVSIGYSSNADSWVLTYKNSDGSFQHVKINLDLKTPYAKVEKTAKKMVEWARKPIGPEDINYLLWTLQTIAQPAHPHSRILMNDLAKIAKEWDQSNNTLFKSEVTGSERNLWLLENAIHRPNSISISMSNMTCDQS